MFRCAKYFHMIKFKGQEISPSTADSQDNLYLDRAFIRRWKAKIYAYLERLGITQANFEEMGADEVYEKVTKELKPDFVN